MFLNFLVLRYVLFYLFQILIELILKHLKTALISLDYKWRQLTVAQYQFSLSFFNW